MALDKLVDSAQLDSDLEDVADAIRAKSGGSSQLAFPAGFISEIGSIQTGGGAVYEAPKSGYLYTPDYTQTVTIDSWETATTVPQRYAFNGAIELVNYRLIVPSGQTISFDSTRTGFFGGCAKLESVWLDIKSSYLTGANIFSGCSALKTVTVGNVGKPFAASDILSTIFNGRSTLETITFYVAAETLADVPANLISGQPFGATNATVIYKNSTTGEVITA